MSTSSSPEPELPKSHRAKPSVKPPVGTFLSTPENFQDPDETEEVENEQENNNNNDMDEEEMIDILGLGGGSLGMMEPEAESLIQVSRVTSKSKAKATKRKGKEKEAPTASGRGRGRGAGRGKRTTKPSTQNLIPPQSNSASPSPSLPAHIVPAPPSPSSSRSSSPIHIPTPPMIQNPIEDEDTRDKVKQRRRWLEEELVRRKDRGEPVNSVPGGGRRGRKLEGGDEESDWRVYCVCRSRYNESRSMIQCDRCDGWFHIDCCQIDEDTLELIDTFICPECHQDGFRTTFVPKCIRSSCSRPRQHLSKYCSDYCGVEVAIDKLEKAERKQNIEPMRFWSAVKGAREGRPTGIVKLIGTNDGLGQAELSEEELKKIERYKIAAMKEKLEEVKKFKSNHTHRISLIDKRLKILQVAILRWEELFKATMTAIRESGGSSILDESTSSKKSKSSKSKQSTAKEEAPCGFDHRLVMDDEEFESWIETDDGKRAMVYLEGGEEGEEGWVCLMPRKKCLRHDGWKEIKEADWEVEKSIVVKSLKKFVAQEKDLQAKIEALEESSESRKRIREMKMNSNKDQSTIDETTKVEEDGLPPPPNAVTTSGKKKRGK